MADAGPDALRAAFNNVFILLLIGILAFSICLLSVIKYESVIYEFDPYFNYRVTQIADALKVNDKFPNALCMLGPLELKSGDWEKAKETFIASNNVNNRKYSYATLSMGNWNYFAAVRSDKRGPMLEATHLDKAKKLYK